MIIPILKKSLPIGLLFILITTSFSLEPVQILKHAWEKEGTIQLYGRMSSQGYFGDRKVLSEVELYWLPPKKIRREFISQKELRLILVSDETSEWRYFPKRKVVMYSSVSPEMKMTPERWALLQKNYTIKYLGTHKILDRPAVLIQIEPKHTYNPSRQLWIDIKHPIVLKSEQYNSDTQLVLTSYFTEISFNRKCDLSLFTIPTTTRVINQSETVYHRYTLKEGEQQFHYSLKTATYLPQGYIFDGCYSWQPRERSEMPSMQLRYTDGLNTISIFEHLRQEAQSEKKDENQHWYNRNRNQRSQPAESEQNRRRHNNRESESRDQEDSSVTRPQGKLVRVVKDNIQCVLFADLPQSELQKIAQNLH
jgi:outer membrane lipoprotein-sorting protein